jgi:hypothetical protein
VDGLNTGDLRYQHNNWAVHSATIVREWLDDQSFETIEWPSHSPDLNSTENVWGVAKR